MFFCDECGAEAGWPESMRKSQGPCEICRKVAICNDIPSSALPTRKPPTPTPEETQLAELVAELKAHSEGLRKGIDVDALTPMQRAWMIEQLELLQQESRGLLEKIAVLLNAKDS